MDSLFDTLKQKSTYELVLLIYSTIIVILPPILLFINAPYGKFAHSNNLVLGFGFSKKWSKLTWFTMEIVSPVVFTLVLYLLPPNDSNGYTRFQMGACALWYIHYINRTFIYSYRVPSMAPMALVTCISAIGFNMVNGYMNAYWIATTTTELSSMVQWIGICLWLFGFGSNIYHDSILFDLRKSKSGYSIPMGGLYRYISCPNYFSECVEWIGYAMFCASPPSFWFALGTMANLIPRAYKSHQWYQQQFKNYPSNRNAIIPFVL
ncbi:3-oxo-5-alpha-steroid 4-dehydrogenase-domain-containing protein [Chlamydoabsidia padenii]|nr:3-oxo-5-alpha-steroid 4-dehydrogenase-domain-containing protein [Chlamydoabsidia padenii]